MTFEDLPYRPSVGVALFNRDGKVFLGRRKRRRGVGKEGAGYEWQMPQGGIDRGETPRAAALRSRAIPAFGSLGWVAGLRSKRPTIAMAPGSPAAALAFAACAICGSQP